MEEMTYEDALATLERLTDEMEKGTIGIEQMADRLQQAQKLLDSCKQRLAQAEKNCNALLNARGND